MGYRNYNRTSSNSIWNTSNPLVMLIILNAMMLILLNFLKSIYTFSSIPESSFYANIYHYFAMPADLSTLLMRPWTILTMQFSEVKVFFAISNIFWLWVFGNLIQDLVGGDKLIPLYLYSGFISAIAFVAISNIYQVDLSSGIYFTGVSSILLGLAVAASTISPSYRFFPLIGGGIPLWVITLVYALVDLSALANNLVMIIPHLFAGLMGFVFVKCLQKGIDLGDWMNSIARKFSSLLTPSKKQGTSIKTTSFYKQGTKSPFVKKSTITQDRIDAILDKINQQGYEKLNDEEKKILKQASKEDL
jgi:membrane associated rhomboid family serine protease